VGAGATTWTGAAVRTTPPNAAALPGASVDTANAVIATSASVGVRVDMSVSIGFGQSAHPFVGTSARDVRVPVRRSDKL
jgi:hypothetical protein